LKAEGSEFQRLEIDLEDGIITEVEHTRDPNVVQFVYLQAKPLLFHIFTWDLKKNSQCLLHKFKPTESQPAVSITRGVSGRDNYFVP
jgi:hypothetical protein